MIGSISKIMENVGFLQLVIGPMYSGKTSHIIELKNQYELCNINYIIINYKEDNRYHDKYMATHDKKFSSCLNSLTLKEIINEENLNKYDVFMINEAQFFPDLDEYVKLLVEKYNKTVHVCGLDGDFERKGFENIINLIPFADEIIKKHALCVKCKNGNHAIFSHRLTNESERKVIGSENYIPLCRKCYLENI